MIRVTFLRGVNLADYHRWRQCPYGGKIYRKLLAEYWCAVRFCRDGATIAYYGTGSPARAGEIEREAAELLADVVGDECGDGTGERATLYAGPVAPPTGSGRPGPLPIADNLPF